MPFPTSLGLSLLIAATGHAAGEDGLILGLAKLRLVVSGPDAPGADAGEFFHFIMEIVPILVED